MRDEAARIGMMRGISRARGGPEGLRTLFGIFDRRKNFFTALAPCAHVAPYAFLQNMTDICLPSAEGTEGAEQPRILTAMSFCGCRVRQENCFSQREQLLQISENRDFMQALLRSDEAAAKALQKV